MSGLKLSVDRLKNNSVAGLVLLLTAVAVLSMAAVAGFYHVALGSVAHKATDASATAQERLRSSYTLIESISVTQGAVQILLREKDPDVLEKLVANLEARQNELASRIEALGESGEAVRERAVQWRGACDHIVQTFLRGENAEANSELVNRLLPESDNVSAEVRKINEINDRLAAEQTLAMEAEIVRIRNRAMATVGIAALIVSLAGLVLWRQVARGTGAVAEMVGRMTTLRAANEQLEQRVRERTADIERSNAQMAAIHRTSLDCVFVTDAKWRTLEFNPSAQRAFQCTQQDALGRMLSEFVQLPEAAGKGFALGRKIEVIARRLDGSKFPAEVVITAADVEGPPVYIASLRDLTEQKKAEAEREVLNNRLLSASRQAGMAEVATGVLHNVGNVLNSVNVSATVVADRLRQSEIASLTKVGQIIRENETDIARYLTTDERGKLVPGFVADLADCLQQEHEQMLTELSALTKGIEHIKQVITAQQSFGTVSTVLSPTSPIELFESALTMQGGSLERHQIELTREFESVERVELDKHKVLQILINLITNAKQAVKLAKIDTPRIVLAINTVEGENKRLRFQVIDNGMGISAENQTRIFGHGFTTKKGGHGFGLHAAANSAREMGGSLTASSQGPMKGATFTLELPITSIHAENTCKI